ncbi:hypothetical protein [Dyella sp. C11]|uniref:hypothetical protein n=1 Tax=Dyella sp. C11 TaxID=2126991 RepID=UPI000D64E83A|nr:hypothetical protein [Dyella sp. C11]
MKMKSVLIGAAMLAACAAGTVAVAQEGGPFVDIGQRHGNLRHAQENIVAAYQYVGNAQAANEDQLGGHAARAKELLAEANRELRLAANVANRND